ncbi:GGDEF domain-containing protein [Vibrio chagasii]|nr:GGDEF domain-containing protein [Vibrio chagasii]
MEVKILQYLRQHHLLEGEKAIQVVVEDVTSKVALEKELIHRALHDDLTQVLTRQAVYDWLKKPTNNQANMSCLLLDIDDFKNVNDQFGHSVGDTVIRTLATIIKKHVKALNGVVGQVGVEEFIVFFSEVSDKPCHCIVHGRIPCNNCR